MRVLDVWGTAFTLYYLAGLAHDVGDYQRATAHYRESIALWHEQGHTEYLARCLDGLAQVAAAQKQWERAAQIWGAAEVLFEASGLPLPPFERKRYDLAVESVRTQLNPAQFVRAWAAGRALTLEQLLTIVDAAPAQEQ